MENELIHLLKEVVGCRTLSHERDDILALYDWIKKHYGKNLHVESFEQNTRESLILSSKPGKKFKLILSAHVDVVPAEPEMFNLKEKEGRLIGRGALDMKFALACYLKLISDLGDDTKNFDFAIMLTSDEEIGGFDGAGALAAAGYTADCIFLPDGSYDWNLEIAAKGVFQIEVTSTGKTGHSSRPWVSENANAKLILFLKDIQDHFNSLATLYTDDDHFYPTLNIGIIGGGLAANQVPDKATATLDIRYPYFESLSHLQETLHELTEKHGVTYEVRLQAPPAASDTDTPQAHTWREIVEEKIGKEITTTKSHGATDARFFSEKNIPMIITTPTGGDLHGKNEWIDKQAFLDFYDCLLEFVKKVA